MATIYQLSDRLGQSASAAVGSSTDEQNLGRSATIILFTGVRYERWTDATDTAAQDAVDEPWTQGPASGTSQR